MAQQNNDLTLGTGLIRKGEARGISPALAVPPKLAEPIAPTTPADMPVPPAAPVPTAALQPEPPQPAQVATPMPSVAPQAAEEADPPLRAVPPDDVAKRFTSFRLPVSLDEDLRAMMFETRRSKQDLLIDFVTEGVKGWKRDRARRG
jgi:hypothetical protein